MSIRLEDVDLIRKRTGVSYNDAKEALEQCNNDLVEALAYIEKKNNLKTNKVCCGENLVSKSKDLIKKGNKTRFILKKKDDVVLNLPVTIAGIVTVVAFPLAAAGLVLAIATNHKVKIEKQNGEEVKTTEVFEKMSSAVNNVSSQFSK